MKKLLLAVLVAGLLGMAGGNLMAATSTDSANINLLVTPVYTVDLNVNPTYYNFGNVNVQVTTCSVAALTLSNNGTIGFKVDKAVWDDGVDWEITKSSTEQNGFDLWAMVQAAAPGKTDYDNATNYKFTKVVGESGFTNLIDKDASATQVNMDPTFTENLWFRLDMPKYVENVNQQTIKIRLRATAK